MNTKLIAFISISAIFIFSNLAFQIVSSAQENHSLNFAFNYIENLTTRKSAASFALFFYRENVYQNKIIADAAEDTGDVHEHRFLTNEEDHMDENDHEVDDHDDHEDDVHEEEDHEDHEEDEHSQRDEDMEHDEHTVKGSHTSYFSHYINVITHNEHNIIDKRKELREFSNTLHHDIFEMNTPRLCSIIRNAPNITCKSLYLLFIACETAGRQILSTGVSLSIAQLMNQLQRYEDIFEVNKPLTKTQISQTLASPYILNLSIYIYIYTYIIS